MTTETKHAVYVGDKPIRAYEDYAVSLLRQVGTAVLMSRGSSISRTIYLAHRIVRDLEGARIVDEHTYLERLPYQGPEDAEERMRDVPVYSATLILEADLDQSSDLTPIDLPEVRASFS